MLSVETYSDKIKTFRWNNQCYTKRNKAQSIRMNYRISFELTFYVTQFVV